MDLQSLFGDVDSNVKLIEKALEVAVTGRDNVIKISGEFFMGLYFAFGTPDAPMFFGNTLYFSSSFASILYYFTVCFLFVCIGEMILGSLTELLCGIIWWNYTDIPLHISKYTSIPTSLACASIITRYMKFFFNPLMQIFLASDVHLLSLLSIALISFLSFDFVHSGVYMFLNRKLLDIWSIKFKKQRRQE